MPTSATANPTSERADADPSQYTEHSGGEQQHDTKD